MTVTWIDRMAVDTRGEGDAVVFVHGLGGSMNVWTPLLPALTRYRCIRPELPGSGRSNTLGALRPPRFHRRAVPSTDVVRTRLPLGSNCTEATWSS